MPDFSTRLIERQAKDGMWQEEDVKVNVDPLSLSSLLSQGFDEAPARRALRIHNNNTQAAMEWLVNGERTKEPEVTVRMPTTIKRIQKLKEKRKQKAEREKAERDSKEKPDDKDKGEKKEVDPKGPPEEAQARVPMPDLLNFDSPVPQAPVPVVNDLLDLGSPQGGAPPPTGPGGYPATNQLPVDLM